MVCNTTSPLLCGKMSEKIQTHLQLHSFFQQVTSTSREQQDSMQRVPIQQHPRRPMVNTIRAGNVVTVPKHKMGEALSHPWGASASPGTSSLLPSSQSGLMLLQLPVGTWPEEKGSTISRSAWKKGQLFSPAAEGCLFWARSNSTLSPQPCSAACGEAEGHNLPGGSRALSHLV